MIIARFSKAKAGRTMSTGRAREAQWWVESSRKKRRRRDAGQET